MQFNFKPKLYLWLITIIGILFYFLGLLFLLYGIAILIDDFFRELFFNLGIASFIGAVIVFYIGYTIISRYGVENLEITDDKYIIKKKLGRNIVIHKKEILYIELQKSNPIIEILPLSSPSILVVTHLKVFKLNSIKYKKKESILEFFEEEKVKYVEEFALLFHKSQNSIKRFIFRFTQDTPGVIGLIIIIIFGFLAVWGAFAMIISPTSPRYTHTLFLRNPEYGNWGLEGYSWETAVLAAPSSNFWFGTDFAGRDLFARMIFGTTFTFIIALSGALLSIFFILLFGLSSAFSQGYWDQFVSRVSDSLLSFPPFIFLVLLSAISIPLRASIPGGFFLAVYSGMSIVTWPAGSRIIRSEVKELLATEFIIASQLLGASKMRIMRKHVLPQILPTIFILFTYQMTDIILGTTLLGYVGFGSESTLTWGSDLSHALYGFSFVNSWWTIVFPSLFIFLLVFGLTLFSDSIRDNLDPQLQGGEKSLPYEIRVEMGL